LLSDINDSQGSVATYARSDGMYNDHFTVNLPTDLSMKKIVNRSKVDRIMVVSLWPHFLAYPVQFWGQPVRNWG